MSNENDQFSNKIQQLRKTVDQSYEQIPSKSMTDALEKNKSVVQSLQKF